MVASLLVKVAWCGGVALCLVRIVVHVVGVGTLLAGRSSSLGRILSFHLTVISSLVAGGEVDSSSRCGTLSGSLVVERHALALDQLGVTNGLLLSESRLSILLRSWWGVQASSKLHILSRDLVV